MATFFLIIIYLAFISLGLPDSLLGTAWPVMRLDLEAPLAAAGIISMTISGGTILSSLASGYIINKLGTGKVTLISCLVTASALLGFALSPSFIWLIVLAIPLGLGAGTVDSALNNYVATHYQARHMSWLHCFWGVGATLGPIIMGAYIQQGDSWKSGYKTVSILQFALTIVLLITLPLWKRSEKAERLDKAGSELLNIVEKGEEITQTNTSIFKIKGLWLSLVSFLFYCGAEATMGLWGSSFLVQVKNLPPATAAQWVSMYYGGITIGRLITGFLTMRVSNPKIIRIGHFIALFGAALLLLPLPAVFSFVGFLLIGLGCAPIFPSMLHETPVRFGKENSGKIMGYQMAFAYTGSTFLPPVLGLIASYSSMVIMPFFVVVYVIAMLLGTERINGMMRANNRV